MTILRIISNFSQTIHDDLPVHTALLIGHNRTGATAQYYLYHER